jgi:hypothetical protein
MRWKGGGARRGSAQCGGGGGVRTAGRGEPATEASGGQDRGGMGADRRAQGYNDTWFEPGRPGQSDSNG